MFDLILGKSQEIERKSYLPNSFSSLLNLCDAFNYSEGSSSFLAYYKQNSAVATAIKTLSDNATTIEFAVRDKKAKKFIDHEVLGLLANPNQYTDGKLFESELIGFFILTGNEYLRITGSSKPVEIFNLNPSGITINPSATTGYADSYLYSYGNQALTFKANAKGKYEAPGFNELTQLRNFNPNFGYNNLFGISELKGCELEIALHSLANIHNYSLLKNQARPSGLITYKGDGALSDSQIELITKTLRESLSGASNSGKATFLSGDFDWTQLSESMKDMDFSTLYRRTAEAIYNTLKIPLPLVSPDNMTLANMETAKTNLFDNAIVPLKRTICSFLTRSLMPRYKNSENLEITFDESEIEVLKPREVKNALDISKAGILTRDEIRASIGYDPMTNGTGDQIVGGQQSAQPAAEPAQKSELKHLMQNLLGKDGKPIYSEDFINETLK